MTPWMPKRSSTADRAAGRVEGRLERTVTHATPEGTARYATRFAESFVPDYFRATPMSLQLSSIGVGTYLGDSTNDDDERYVAVVRRALAEGINVIDTAINYRCQRSERAVGAALERAIADGVVRRDEVVVCSKGGFVPLDGAPPAKRSDYVAYVQREFFDAGVMRPNDVDSGGHSMAPGFLRYCIAHSRRNLGVSTIDVYYLHNPEQQLASMSPASFREHVRAAFMVFEDAVSRGEIGVYGCATWTGLRASPTTKSYLDLAALVQIAREVAGDAHHFRAVQLPINLAMTEAVRAPTQRRADGTMTTLLEVAQDLGVSVMASASLMQGQLTQGLPAPMRELFPSMQTDAQRALAFVRSLPSLTTALVGMKTPAHLEENLKSVQRERD